MSGSSLQNAADAAALARDYPRQDVWIRRLRRERGIPDTAQFVLTPADSAQWKALDDAGNKLAGELAPARVARAARSSRSTASAMRRAPVPVVGAAR